MLIPIFCRYVFSAIKEIQDKLKQFNARKSEKGEQESGVHVGSAHTGEKDKRQDKTARSGFLPPDSRNKESGYRKPE